MSKKEAPHHRLLPKGKNGDYFLHILDILAFSRYKPATNRQILVKKRLDRGDDLPFAPVEAPKIARVPRYARLRFFSFTHPGGGAPPAKDDQADGKGKERYRIHSVAGRLDRPYFPRTPQQDVARVVDKAQLVTFVAFEFDSVRLKGRRTSLEQRVVFGIKFDNVVTQRVARCLPDIIGLELDLLDHFPVVQNLQLGLGNGVKLSPRPNAPGPFALQRLVEIGHLHVLIEVELPGVVRHDVKHPPPVEIQDVAGIIGLEAARPLVLRDHQVPDPVATGVKDLQSLGSV